MAIVGEAHIIVRAITTGVGPSIQNAFRQANATAGRSGSQMGRSFTQGFSRSSGKSFSKFRQEALGAADAFASLTRKGYALAPAIAVAAGGLASLVSGLVAFGAQLGAALPSLIVFPSALTALAQAAITAKLALGGVFKAVGELGRAKAPAVDQMPAKLRAFENAQRRVKDAQEALNRAYRAAEERLQQLGFDSEDAALAQQRAAMDLEDARKTLQRVQDLPPNSRARQEAELAFKEADLNYRRAIDRSSDLVEEQNRVSENGTLTAEQQVEQSDEVLGAQRELRDSFVALADAQKDLKKAQSGGGAQLTEFNKLSKEAQEFAKYLASLSPEIQKLKDAAGRKMFAPLEEGIQNLVDNFFPRLIPLLEDTGEAFGNTMLDFSKIVTEENNLKNFETVGRTNIDTIGKLGTVTGNLYSAFLSLMAAADPLVRRFTDWLVTLTGTWKESSEAANQTGKLTERFEYAGDVAAQLGRTFRNIWEGLKNIGKAAAGPGSGGEMLVNAFEKATERFKEFTGELEKSGKLEEYFKGVAENVIAIGGAVSTLALEFLKLGDDEAVGKTAKLLPGIFEAIGGALAKVMEAAPAMGEFGGKLVDFFALFAESESINNFFKALSFAMDILLAIFSNPVIQKIALFVGAQLAFVKAAQLMFIVGKGAFLILSGYVMKLVSAFKFLSGSVSFIAYIFGVATIKVWLIIAAVAAVIAIFVIMYNKSETLRKAIKDLVENVMGALKDGWDRINEAIKEAMPSVDGVGGLFQRIGDTLKTVGDFIGTFIVPLFSVILVGAIGMIVDRIVGFIKIVGGIIDIFRAVWQFLQGIWALITGDTDKAVEKFRGAFSSLVSGIGNIFGGIFDIVTAPFRMAFNLIARMWNNTVGKLSFKVPSWVPGFGGKGFDVPDIPLWGGGGGSAPRGDGFTALNIPQFALGGTVMPRRGGTLGLIAEAGRPERIEPLDPDGLSRRDKAIISMLSGGAAAGATINVYPSPGMNEVELAALVNRQLSFAMKKGAA
jgi:hypothetical protein